MIGLPKNKALTRDPERGKVAGVCAGIADYFGIEVWLVRIVTASMIILTGFTGIPLLLYLVAWCVLDKKSASYDDEDPVLQSHFHRDVGIKNYAWQQGKTAHSAVKDLESRYQRLEQRLQHLETHVTSQQFDLRREIDSL